jgi:hypothetical protein
MSNIIFVFGPSCSEKSTLAQALQKNLGSERTVKTLINHKSDSYVKYFCFALSGVAFSIVCAVLINSNKKF